MLKGTLIVFIFFIGIAFISVGCVTVSKVWVVTDVAFGTASILGTIVFTVVGVIRKMRG